MSNIQVLVRTNYVEAQSIPLEHRYVYTYTITIANKSDVPAQLISRHCDPRGALHTLNGST
jgi:ApaG protein